MKALVTGATGFIGSSVVRELLKDNVEVKVLVREKSDTRNIDGLDIEKISGDIRDGESVKSALKGCNVFYQVAALFVITAPEKLFYDINVEGTKTALNAALQAGVEKVVYTSTMGTIACSYDPSKVFTESARFNMQSLGPYVRSKYAGEQAALEIAKNGLPMVIVNPTFVVGVRDVKPAPGGQNILSILNKTMPGTPAGGTNFVDVEDLARGHILAAQKGKIGERYILGNTNMTYNDFYHLVGEIAGVTPPQRVYSRSVMVSMGYMLQLLSFFTRKPPVIDAATARMACSYLYFDCSKAIKELGIPQTPIRTTVTKAVNWFKENGYVKSGN